MSHFVLAAIIPKNKADDYEDFVEKLLEPFDEDHDVEPYPMECYCVGNLANFESRKRADELYDIVSLHRKYWDAPENRRPEIEKRFNMRKVISMTTTGRYIIQNEDQSSRDDLRGASLPLPNPSPNSPLHPPPSSPLHSSPNSPFHLSQNSSIHPSDSPLHRPSKPSPTDIMSSPNWSSLPPSQSSHHPTLTEDLSTQHRLSVHGDITNDIIDDIISRKDDITYDITRSEDDITHDITRSEDDITYDITLSRDDITHDITSSDGDIMLLTNDVHHAAGFSQRRGLRRRRYLGYVPNLLYHGTSWRQDRGCLRAGHS